MGILLADPAIIELSYIGGGLSLSVESVQLIDACSTVSNDFQAEILDDDIKRLS